MMNSENYICPECGAEPDKVYVDRLGQIVGCDRCLLAKWTDEVEVNNE